MDEQYEKPPEAGRAVKICLAGCAGDTYNLGVRALLSASLLGIAKRFPHAKVTVFDNGWGVRQASIDFKDSRFSFEQCGVRLSRRYYRPESFFNIGIAARLGGLSNPAARALLEADALWDISGGDSFTDLYGRKRFRATMAPKHIALSRKVPLLLLPQTYGPFSEHSHREAAALVLRRCSASWARDPDSFVAMRELLGNAFDGSRHRMGVDVAFALPPRRPGSPLPSRIEAWLSDPAVPTIGLNVSGLLHNDPNASKKYSFRADYREVIHGIVRRILVDTTARILFIPHVPSPAVTGESDLTPYEALVSDLKPVDRDRVTTLPPLSEPNEVKWVIARLDWFCGTRMHSTIASLSSGVPTAAIAYSPKTRGVFETCGQEEHVADPRTQNLESTIETLWSSWMARREARESLGRRLPAVLETAEGQMDQILDATMSKHDPQTTEPHG